MSIYMVQQTFSRPEWEDEWNAWYAGNLKVLMSVPGFRTGQRFKAMGEGTSRYMAMYTVDSAEVFETQFYKDSGGGGTASQRFRPAYLVWIRNLFEGIDKAPAVGDGECLVFLDGDSQKLDLQGVSLTTLQCTGFHRTTPCRGIGVVNKQQAQGLAGSDKLGLYLPITAQLGPLY